MWYPLTPHEAAEFLCLLRTNLLAMKALALSSALYHVDKSWKNFEIEKKIEKLNIWNFLPHFVSANPTYHTSISLFPG